jgi:phospholipid/cholesterol/gamma-HCH transport system substrate-binding protein
MATANNERAMRYGLGLFVLLALTLLTLLLFLFGVPLGRLQRTNPYTVVFTDAPGISKGAPVRRSGVRIGEVTDVALDDETGLVRVHIEVDRKYTVRRNEVPTLFVSLLGTDASIDFIPKEEKGPPDRTPVEPGEELVGARAANVNALLTRASEVVPTTQETLNDMRKSLQRLEKTAAVAEDTMREYQGLSKDVRRTIPSLEKTNDEARRLMEEWRKVGVNANDFLVRDDIGALARLWTKFTEEVRVLYLGNQDKIQRAIDDTSGTLKNARAASDNLPAISRNVEELTREAQPTLRRLNQFLDRGNEVLNNIDRGTKPIYERGPSIARNLDESLDKLNRTLTDVRRLVDAVGQSDGTLHRFLNDPSLYNHLDDAACLVAKLMPRLDRILKDFETFADKLARHPEAIGVGGVVRPGSGLKDPPSPPQYPHGP